VKAEVKCNFKMTLVHPCLHVFSDLFEKVQYAPVKKRRPSVYPSVWLVLSDAVLCPIEGQQEVSEPALHELTARRLMQAVEVSVTSTVVLSQEYHI
jgi:hypothetical protein